MWSSGITMAQAQSIERVQRRALRIIAYPHVLPYNDLLNLFNVQLLSHRRNQLTLKFAKSLLSNRHRYLLPPTRQTVSGRSLRNSTQITMPQMRTQSFKKSPIPSMIGILNAQ